MHASIEWAPRVAVLPLFLLGAGDGEAPAPPSAGVDPAPSRNVLVIVADDLGVDVLTMYGEGRDLPPTPHLDALAAEGVLFRNAWSQPVCSATRATILTGRYAFRTGIGAVVQHNTPGAPALPLDELTLPEMLDAGTGETYAHAAIGKWHLGSDAVGGDLAPNMAGFGHFAGVLDGQLVSYFDWNKVVDGEREDVHAYATTETVDDALEWIGEQSRPWLCYVAFAAPHAPFHAPPRDLHTRVFQYGASPKRECDDDGDSPREYYDAMVEAMDTEIGRLVGSLPPHVRARTTVIFLGDNGTPTCVTEPPFDPEHAKASLYEGGVNVPLVVAGPLVREPGECAALVNTTDVFATVAELAGVDLGASFPEREFDSVSLVPYLEDPARPSLRDWVFAEYFTPNGPRATPTPELQCPGAERCQLDMGYGGPGDMVLSACGDPLHGVYGGYHVPIEVTGGAPNQLAVLFVGPEARPRHIAFVNGTLVPYPEFIGLVGLTDANGELHGAYFAASRKPVDLFVQVVATDPNQELGYAASNALRLRLLPTDMRAIRGERYKLIQETPCRVQMYDLDADPFEEDDLLAGELDAEQAERYAFLRQRLEVLK